MIFTHPQSLALDKKRIHLEFGSKPILTTGQLKLLRKILNMNLEEICRLLHIGKNSYGRWERGRGDQNLSLDESPGSPTDRTFSRGEGQPDRVGDTGREGSRA
jgi:DNA-binding XRE family transcriptional regulator